MYRKVGSALLKTWPLALAVVFVAGVAVASIPNAQGVFNGCVAKGGRLRVIDTEKGQTCKRSESPIDWNRTGPPGPPATLPSGTITGAQMFVGSLDPNDYYPAANEASFSCPDGKVAIAGTGWYQSDSVPQTPIEVQIADSGSFRTVFEVDWTTYYNSLEPSSRVSWNVTCGNVSP